MSWARFPLNATERTVLRLRARSVRRTAVGLARADLFGTLLVLAATAWVLTAGATVLRGPDGPWAAAAVVATLLWIGHGMRRDQRFLHLVGARVRRILIAEYLALGVTIGAVVVVLLGMRASPPRLIAALLIPGLCVAIAFLPSGNLRRTGVVRAISVVPADTFEWIAALRGAWPALLALHAVLLVAVWYIPGAVLVGLALLTLSVAGWYGAAVEGWEAVVAFRRRPRRFLLHKCQRALRSFGMLAAPIIVTTLLLHPQTWRAVALALVASAVVVTGAVLAKYARFVPGRPSAIGFALVVLALAVSLAVPPLCAWILFELWRRALRALHPYVG